jgi:exodeoxyribonuclease VIII
MTRDAYTALPGVNFSKLKNILRSPAHFIAGRDEQPTEEDELRFAVGSLCHAMVLEGKNLLDLYAIKPKGMSFATKEGKAWKAAQTKPILENESAAKIPLMSEAVLAHPLAKFIIESCPDRELVLQAQISHTLCKGMLDALGKDRRGTPVIPDYKTTADGRPDKFKWKIRDFHYDMQAEMYKTLARECRDIEAVSLWIVQETTAPYVVEVYSPSADTIAQGQEKLTRALDTYHRCLTSGVWHGYSTEPGIREI